MDGLLYISYWHENLNGLQQIELKVNKQSSK